MNEMLAGKRNRHVPSSAFRQGFTLVELLVVIAIIGILAALVTVAAQSVLKSAKVTRMKMEIMSMDQAERIEEVGQLSARWQRSDSRRGYPATCRRHSTAMFPAICRRTRSPRKTACSTACPLILRSIPPMRFISGWRGPKETASAPTLRTRSILSTPAAPDRRGSRHFTPLTRPLLFPGKAGSSISPTMAIRPPWACAIPNAPFIYFAARAGTYAADSTSQPPGSSSKSAPAPAPVL